MAEVLEEMQERALPEYEDMLRFGVCTDEKLKICIAKRRSFHAKITQGEKSIRSFVDYIIFEKLIHKWVMEKESQYGNALTSLKAAIVKRIMILYRQGLQQFPHETRLWQNFISFCKKSAKHEVMGIYEKMLSYHADEPFLWCSAGLWAYEYTTNMPKVKEIFVRALQRHNDSEIVYSTFFQILLSQAADMSDERDLENGTVSEQDLGLERVEVIYRNSRRVITNIHFYLGLLERCEVEHLCVVSARIQKTILDDVMASFSNEEILWHTLAQRELRGFNLGDLQKFYRDKTTTAENIKTEPPKKKAKLEIKLEADDSEGVVKKDEMVKVDGETSIEGEENANENSYTKFEWQKRSMTRRIQLCYKTYHQAVWLLKTEQMYEFFINAMLTINEDTSTDGELKRRCLAAAFSAGHESEVMSEEHYFALMDMLTKTDDNGWKRGVKILTEALKFKRSVKLHHKLMQLLWFGNDQETFQKMFRSGVDQFGPSNSYSLYDTAIQCYILENPRMALKIYHEVAEQRDSKLAEFRTEYLDHVSSRYGIERARKLYDELCQFQPPVMSLHLSMAKWERLDAPADTESRRIETPRWRLCYERNVLHFGKSETKAWMDYINFEKDHGNLKNVSLLYERAKNTLNDALVEKFISEYALLQEI